MNNLKQHRSKWFAFFVIGGLIGSTIMLLFTPRSGKRNRKQIRRVSNRLKKQAIANTYLSTKRMSYFIRKCLPIIKRG